MEELAEFIEQWAGQSVIGFRYLTEWSSLEDFSAWIAQILPPPWQFEIHGEPVGLVDYLGPDGAFYTALNTFTGVFGMADYVIDVRVFLLCLHIGLAARVLVFAMEHWTFIARWRRGRQG